MKTLKLLAMLGALGGVLMFGTGCNSTEQPIDEKYTGTYRHNGGSIEVTKTTVSSINGVKLPVLTVDGKQHKPAIGYFVVKWNPTSFNYLSDHSYNFTTNVTATDISPTQTTVEGESYFHGSFGEQLETYSITIIDDYGTSNLFTRDKPKNANVSLANNRVDENAYTYDVNSSNDDDEVDLLEEIGSAISDNVESDDRIDENNTYTCDVNSSDDNGEANLLEENIFAISDDIKSNDSVDDDVYAYELSPSDNN